MALRVDGVGPANAEVMVVGEAPGQDEEVANQPFIGASGQLLTTLLREAGIDRSKCYVTNVCKYRPPGNDMGKWLTDSKTQGVKNEWEFRNGKYAHDLVIDGADELLRDIERIRPKVIVGLGNTPLWALTGQWGITDWRGSEMRLEHGERFVPTLHPAAVLRSWPTRAQVAHDLRFRVARRLRLGFTDPEWDHVWNPTFREALDFIQSLQGDTSADVETSRGRIVCLGLATSARRAMCIPFFKEEYAEYWTAWEKQTLLEVLCNKMHDGSCNWIWQNGNYDASYFDDDWGFVPPNDFDTLIAQSVLYPGTPRGLGYLSSMYCDWHCYWKDDARDWQNLRDFDSLFRYNCRDVCATWEVAQGQRKALASVGLTAQFEDRVKYNRHVYNMMQRGVIRDAGKTQALEAQIEEALQKREVCICDAAGHPVNPNSPVQVSKWLYDEAGCRKPARRGKEMGGTGDTELEQVAKWHPELQAPITAVVEYRALASVRNNVLNAKLDPDGRLRSSFMTTGTETFRLTSSKNNFGRGCNLLNVTAGSKDKGIPNMRDVFVPPPGYGIFDCDLEKADVWVVAWEANDDYLKQKLSSGNLHKENAKDLFGLRNVGEVTPEQYFRAKRFVHLTDYGGGSRTCAIACGITIHEADLAQRRWFAIHPGILDWHKRYEAQLRANRTVKNAFGYRMVYFDRVEGLVKEALAWTPQSTVAIVASKIHMAFDKIPGVHVFIQMYDSVAGYYPLAEEERILGEMATAKDIVVPYDEPLVIPMGLATSRDSWGDCKNGAREWPTLERAA